VPRHLTLGYHRRHWGGTNERLRFVGGLLRNTRDVLNLVHELRQKGAVPNVLEPKFATTDLAGPILVTVLGRRRSRRNPATVERIHRDAPPIERAFEMNSRPLSTLMVCGAPRVGGTLVTASTTCSPLIPWSTSIAKASRV